MSEIKIVLFANQHTDEDEYSAIQQGWHESQGKTCRVINECCERLKNNYSKNVRQ